MLVALGTEKSLQEHYNRRFGNGKWAIRYSNLITKSWYPVDIRCAGVFIWLWALTIDY